MCITIHFLIEISLFLLFPTDYDFIIFSHYMFYSFIEHKSLFIGTAMCILESCKLLRHIRIKMQAIHPTT